ncbi:hypothetical protein [Nocardia vinacea]|uniref:hypothetical protein n=1 Tax=Nocardia vinacea TaxID=96468 RepID=UPI000592E5E5|nr:hypothetical protein [Nocardia vinacea]
MTTELSLDPAVTRAFLDKLRESPAAREAWEDVMRTIRDAAPSILSQIGPALRFDDLASPTTQMNILSHVGAGFGLEAVFAGARTSSVSVIAGSGFYDHLREVFDDVFQRRLHAANWWLPDHVNPAKPSWIRGLEEALPTDYRCRSVDAVINALEHWRALLHYRHQRVPDSPGRLVTARRRVPRGPDFRRLTSPCQLAGLVVRA